MARLPEVSRRFVTSRAPQSAVSPSDIAAPFRMLAGAMESVVPGIDATLERRGEREGFERAVTTGEDGLPEVRLMSNLTGAYGAGFNRAAKWKFLADMGSSIDEQVHAARLENRGNPAGFKTWADSFVRGIERQTRDPEINASASKMAADATGAAFRGLESEFQAEMTRGALASLNTRRSSLENRMFALARSGGTDTPEFAEAMADYQAIGEEIASNPVYGIAPEQVAEADRQLLGQLNAEAGLGIIARDAVPRTPPTGDVTDRIIAAESGGDANAANPGSSASGVGQFLDSTWLSMLKRHRPDIAEGKSDADLLALKTDPALGREMTARQTEENTRALAARGHTASPGNLYLAHFLGAGGATGVLEASPGTPIREALIAGGMSATQADAAIGANPVLQGKTADEVRQWSRGRVGGDDAATLVEDFFWNPDLDLSPEERRRYTTWGMQEVNRADAERQRQRAARAETHERSIIDAQAGQAPMPSREAIEDDPELTESARNTLLRQFDAANAERAEMQRAYDRFAAGDTFNPFESDDRKALDQIYTAMGGDETALTAVVNQTGIAPPVVVSGLRNGMISTDPARVQASMQLAANLLGANPNVFAGHTGSDELRDAALTFRHQIDDLGYTAEEAAGRIAEMNTPEYQSGVRARVKDEDLDELVRDELSVNDLSAAFDTMRWWGGEPAVGISPDERSAMFTDYAELFRDRYRETGDVDLSKTLAQDQLKRLWGVSAVNGSETVMRYPPEMAPVLQGIENPSEAIADQALADITAETGAAPGRDTLRLLPVPGLTADAYKAGEPVPYMLAWEGDDGLIQTLDPGRLFVLDGGAIRARQSASRREQFETRRREREELSEPGPEGVERRMEQLGFGGGLGP